MRSGKCCMVQCVHSVSHLFALCWKLTLTNWRNLYKLIEIRFADMQKCFLFLFLRLRLICEFEMSCCITYYVAPILPKAIDYIIGCFNAYAGMCDFVGVFVRLLKLKRHCILHENRIKGTFNQPPLLNPKANHLKHHFRNCWFGFNWICFFLNVSSYFLSELSILAGIVECGGDEMLAWI